jgi:hypothetical protein
MRLGSWVGSDAMPNAHCVEFSAAALRVASFLRDRLGAAGREHITHPLPKTLFAVAGSGAAWPINCNRAPTTGSGDPSITPSA